LLDFKSPVLRGAIGPRHLQMQVVGAEGNPRYEIYREGQRRPKALGMVHDGTHHGGRSDATKRADHIRPSRCCVT